MCRRRHRPGGALSHERHPTAGEPASERAAAAAASPSPIRPIAPPLEPSPEHRFQPEPPPTRTVSPSRRSSRIGDDLGHRDGPSRIQRRSLRTGLDRRGRGSARRRTGRRPGGIGGRRWRRAGPRSRRRARHRERLLPGGRRGTYCWRSHGLVQLRRSRLYGRGPNVTARAVAVRPCPVRDWRGHRHRPRGPGRRWPGCLVRRNREVRPTRPAP